MTWIPPIAGLQRRDPEHRYWLNGHCFPVSVTGVLRCQKSEQALARIEATAAIWQPRGHQSHRALELFLLDRFQGRSGPDARPLPDGALELAKLRQGEHRAWIAPLLAHGHWSRVQVIAAERATCCLRRNVAGTFDLAYETPRGRVLADLKTLGPQGRPYCTRAQLGAYMALDAGWGQHYDYGQTIWAWPGRTEFSRLYSRQECLLAWAAAWSRYRASDGAALKKAVVCSG